MATAVPQTVPTSDRCESWLLVFNCQVLGLGNCLNLLSDEIHVEHHDPASFRRSAEDILARWDSFERVLIAPQLDVLLPEELRGADKLWRVPTISFTGYHPDICRLTQGGATFKGPMGDYHSIIAFAAYKNGLSAADALELYNEKMYARLGYFNRWDDAKQRLLDAFRLAGFDISPRFADWSRNGAFMYSHNHVQIRCLVDVAKAILKRAGKSVSYEDIVPHDNLLNGPVYPIYPEIGARLGVRGSYLFKPGGQYRFIRLEEFLAQSMEAYAANPDVTATPGLTPVIQSVGKWLGAR